MIDKMSNEERKTIMHKLHFKRNILFRSFVINYAFILVAWGLSYTSWYMNLIARFMGCNVPEAMRYFYEMVGIWKIASVIFFLVPALAIWWEMKYFKKFQK